LGEWKIDSSDIDTKILWGRVRHGVGEKKNKTQENNKSCPKVKLEV